MEVPFYGPDEILKLKDKINTLNTDYMAQKPCILAVETSSRIGSVAIAFGQEIFAETVFSCPLMHSAEIFPAINTLLKSANRRPNQIEHVYISSGPGSFTGLRIATTLAKAMHIANSVKIVTVDTLDVIACNSVDYVRDSIDRKSRPGKSKISIERIATIIDAKRGQFFIAVYNCNLYEADTKNAIFSKQYEKILPDTLMSASEFKTKFAGKNKPVWLLGDGLLYHKDKFKAKGICFLQEKYWSPRANKVHMLGWQMARQAVFADPANLTPFYLSRPDVKIKPR